MKKLLPAFAVLCIVMGVLGGWYLLRSRHGAAGTAPALRAMMQDEEAPRPIEPSIALQVNETAQATVLAGSPVWFTIGVNNAAAVNEMAAARALYSRLSRMPSGDPDRARLEAVWLRRATPARIALGEAGRPWIGALQILVRDTAGGTQPAPWALRTMGSTEDVVELDARTTALAILGAASAPVSPGAYSLMACLGPTGSWRGRVCSEPVRLTIAARPASLSGEQQEALDGQGARFAFLAGDAPALESYGRKLLAADPDSVNGHMYLGEAHYRQEQWVPALEEFTQARADFDRRHPNAPEGPVFLVARINELLRRL